MNAVEAWYLKVPVFSKYSHYDQVLCPELRYLIYKSLPSNVEQIVHDYEPSTGQLNYAKEYAITTHNAHTIANQYISLYHSLQEEITYPYDIDKEREQWQAYFKEFEQ
jgi:hypothetical protein